MRWAVCLPILEGALAEEPIGFRFEISEDETIFIYADEGGGGFGFAEGLPGESLGQAAMRLLDVLVEDLPSTRRAWGLQIPVCPREGHAHAMTATLNAQLDEIDLFCPDYRATPERTIAFPGIVG